MLPDKDEAGRLYARGEQAVAQGDLAQARAIWRRLCEFEPHNVDHWIVLSSLDENLGFPDSAIQQLSQAKLLAPEMAEVWQSSATLCWKHRRHGEALDDWHRALALDFTDLLARSHIATRCFEMGHFKLAHSHAAYLLSRNPDNDRALSIYIASYLLQLDPPKSLKLIRAIPTSVAQSIGDHLVLFLSNDNLRSVQKRVVGLAINGEERDALKIAIQLDPAIYLDHASKFLHPHWLRDKWLITQAPRIYHALLKRLNPQTYHSHKVTELGCMRGGLATLLRDRGVRANITGVDTPDRCARLASNQNYDQLLHYSEWLSLDKQRSSGARLYLIGESVQYSRADCFTDLLHNLQAHQIVCFENLHEEVSGQIKALAKEYKLRCITHKQLLICCTSDDAESVAKAIKARPRAVEDLETRANKLIHAKNLISSGKYQAAESMTQEPWAQNWANPDLLLVKGILAQHRKDYPSAILHLRQALHLNSGNGGIWFQLGTVWQAIGRERSMLRAYQRAVQYSPNHRSALLNMFSHWRQQGNIKLAFNVARQLLIAYPLDDELKKSLVGDIRYFQNEAIVQKLNALLNSVEWHKAYFHASLERQFFQRSAKALEDLKDKIEADDYDALLCSLLTKQDDPGAALEVLQRMVVRQPEKVDYFKQLRHLQCSVGDLEGAHDNWVANKDKFESADGDHQGALFTANYYPWLQPLELAQHHLDWGAALEQQTEQRTGFRTEKGSKRKIRVGFLSGDFKFHSVSMFLHNIFKWHDQSRFEFYAYMCNASEDPMTIKLRSYAHRFRNISQVSDDDAERLIRRDQVDVLIDVAGHTAYNRLPLMARRLAPVQCTYLGYANTTGLSRIDYRFTDAEADPVDQDSKLHSEELVHLSSGFLSYSRHFESPPIKLSPVDEKRARFDFVCCNNVLKINRNSVALFSRVLRAVPNSSLLIKAHNLNNPHILARYRRYFEEEGIAAERVHLMNALDMADHQELYNYAKIALDPSPYAGTTTTCDALWMGVPVLTLRGDRHAARVGVSLLHRIGMDDWIAENEEDFVNKAVAFSKQPKLLNNLRLSLRTKMLQSDLMHPTAVVRALESKLLELVEKNGLSAIA